MDTTITAGSVALDALVDLPPVAEVGVLTLAGLFALSAIRHALEGHSIKNQLKEAGEW